MIWRKSLPGPRTLCFAQAIDTEKLYFPKKHHASNPAALSTCQTSRQVALERYKLVFGTSHVYADLLGGTYYTWAMEQGHVFRSTLVLPTMAGKRSTPPPHGLGGIVIVGYRRS